MDLWLDESLAKAGVITGLDTSVRWWPAITVFPDHMVSDVMAAVVPTVITSPLQRPASDDAFPCFAL